MDKRTAEHLLAYAATLLGRRAHQLTLSSIPLMRVGADQRPNMIAWNPQIATGAVIARLADTPVAVTAPNQYPPGSLYISWGHDPHHHIEQHIPDQWHWAALADDPAERELVLDTYHTLITDGMNTHDAFAAASRI